MSNRFPESSLFQSPVYPLIQAAENNQSGDNNAIDSDRFDPATSLNCALIDLSPLPRIGLRGTGTEAALEAVEFQFPDRPNTAVESTEGQLVLRLGKTECWILDSPMSSKNAELTPEIFSEAEKIYPLYCQHSHAWFALVGNDLPAMLAKLCGVELRPASFEKGAIVQTSIARISGIIVNASPQNTPIFYVLVDSNAAEYLWQVLLDAMTEYGGQEASLGYLRREI